MHDWPIGDWIGSKGQLDGSRLESVLHLGGDGRYTDTVCLMPDEAERVIRGRWSFAPDKESGRRWGDDFLHFQPEATSELGEPPVALGLAACDLRLQPERDKPGMATLWRLVGDRMTDVFTMRCEDPPKLFSTQVSYGRHRPEKVAEPWPSAVWLTRVNDPVLGELVWYQAMWMGWVQIRGRAVRLGLWPFRTEPAPETPEEQRAFIAKWRGALPRLEAVEPELRRKGAEDLANAADLPPAGLAESMELIFIQFENYGELRYVGGFFHLAAIRFNEDLNEDLSYREVEILA